MLVGLDVEDICGGCLCYLFFTKRFERSRDKCSHYQGHHLWFHVVPVTGQENILYSAEHLLCIILQTCFVPRGLCSPGTISLSVVTLQLHQPRRGRYMMQMMTWGLGNLICKKTTCKLQWGKIPVIWMSAGFRARWSDPAGINHCISVEHPSLNFWIQTVWLWMCNTEPKITLWIVTNTLEES